MRAVFATTGGRGAYRIADGLDYDAVRRDPKPLIGFSDITVLHLALWNQVGHGLQPATVPLGTLATIDPTAGTLTVAPGVR
ncbi:hypothetical protein GCM10009789_43360 [Kribbella sancticallisti]|uniref:LD-carboxypeptidase N-terminal domain-containing protein n=1 Tax=Kribbella sancticallisti TaxID=460087 RepID=A0ABN2DSF1_9ACTN